MQHHWKPAMAVLCMASAPCMSAGAQQAGSVALGDEWLFHQVVDAPGKPAVTVKPRFRIHYATARGQLVLAVTASEPAGGKPFWQQVQHLEPSACLVDITGGEPLRTERPCELPEAGKSWEYNARDSVASVEERYTVLGRETVQAGAASYDAIKVEVTHARSEIPYPGVETAPPERKRTLYWFVPAVKSAVKVVREHFDATGARKSLQTDELQWFANVKLPK